MTNEERAEDISKQIISNAKNVLYMKLRFMGTAFFRLKQQSVPVSAGTDGRFFYASPEFIIHCFREDKNYPVYLYLHSILHCVFRHYFVSMSIDRRIWNIACDIAVFAMINDIFPNVIPDGRDYWNLKYTFDDIKNNVGVLTAEKIYYYLKNCGEYEDIDDLQSLNEKFEVDSHIFWYHDGQEQSENSDNTFDTPHISGQSNITAAAQIQSVSEMWAKISQQIQTDLETFSKTRGDSIGCMIQNLRAVNREKYDYSEFLHKFAVLCETMRIDHDNFDYNFYCYGLSLYKNVALIEPLEYREKKLIKEFIIAIDTSGSVSGKTVQRFVQKTYNILMTSDSFGTEICIHIIQCDADIQEDQIIRSQSELEEYISAMTVKGLGGTDFRPVFSYVDSLIESGHLHDLQGLVYFTDGCGVFPDHEPSYKTAFVFLDDEYNNYDVPIWAIKLILQTEDI